MAYRPAQNFLNFEVVGSLFLVVGFSETSSFTTWHICFHKKLRHLLRCISYGVLIIIAKSEVSKNFLYKSKTTEFISVGFLVSKISAEISLTIFHQKNVNTYMGLGRIELPTPRSSAVCSPNELQPHGKKTVLWFLRLLIVDFLKTVFAQ